MFNLLKFIFRRKASLFFFFWLSFSFVLFKVFCVKPTFETEAILVVREADKPVGLETEELDISRTISIVKRHKAKLESNEIIGEVLNKLSIDEKFLEEDSSFKDSFAKWSFNKLFSGIQNQSMTDEEKFMLLADRIRERHLRIEEIPFTDFIKIKARAKDPQLAAMLANTLCQVYIDWVLRFEKDQYTEKVNFINQQLTQTKETLDEYEKKLEQYKNKEGLISVPGDLEDKSEVANLLAADNELEKQNKVLSARVEMLYKNLFKTDLVKLDELKELPSIKSIRQHLVILFLQKIELEETYTAEYPPLQDINALIDPLKTYMRENVTEILQQEVSLNSENSSSVKEIEQLITQYFITDAYQEAVTRKLNKINQKQWVVKEKFLPYQEREIADIDREIDLQGALYKDLLLKKEQLNLLTSRKVPESVRIFSRAPVPHDPKTPPLLMLLIGFILSLILAVFGAIFIDLAESDLRDLSEIENYFGLPLLGTVPHKRKILNFNIHNFRRKNPYQLICAYLQGRAIGQVFQITSTRRGEGKTTTAINLGKTFSLSGQDVLLIETSPINTITFANYYKLKGRPGLFDVFVENVPLEKVIYSTDFDHLKVIPFGCQDFSVTNSDYPSMFRLKAKDVIGILKKQFQIIIMDTCSLEYSYDALLIGRIVDHTIFLISAAKTTKEVALHGKNTLSGGGVKLSGIILNDVRYAIPNYLYKTISKLKLN